jgi:transcriptional regulator with XRE-family HTH domain
LSCHAREFVAQFSFPFSSLTGAHLEPNMDDRQVAPGFKKRLRKALAKGPRPMSQRKFSEKLRGKYRKLRGTSYSGVRLYLEGSDDKPSKPNVGLLRAMADILGVRPEWLLFHEGEMTEDEEKARRKSEWITARTLPPREDFQAARIRDAVYEAMGLPVRIAVIRESEDPEVYGVLLGIAVEPMPPWVAALAEVHLRMMAANIAGTRTTGGGVDPDLESKIGKALADPLRSLGVDPVRMKEEGGGFGSYIFTMVPALLAVAAERKRQQEPTEAEE